MCTVPIRIDLNRKLEKNAHDVQLPLPSTVASNDGEALPSFPLLEKGELKWRGTFAHSFTIVLTG
jgi:hypothetical protein